MKLYTPKEFADEIGVTVRTLHRWDNSDILIANRTPTNRRYYTEEQLTEYNERATRLSNISTFYEYSQRFIHRQSPTGDVARDIDLDETFPKDATDWRTIEMYLSDCGACDACMIASKRLFSSYKHYMRRKGSDNNV